MPEMGESIFEGTITKWLEKPGDKVQRDEPLSEISTDKVDAEIPAPASGTLQEIKVSEGNTVQVNTVVAIIGDGTGVTKQGVLDFVEHARSNRTASHLAEKLGVALDSGWRSGSPLR
jgi:pyruvate/2-oxoglutarate dehydrogenase complex dihydrolipoamide acyltransferase (E2) component